MFIEKYGRKRTVWGIFVRGFLVIRKSLKYRQLIGNAVAYESNLLEINDLDLSVLS